MVIERIFSVVLRISGLGSCKEVQELCYEYVEENVGPGQKKRIQRHLKMCKPCLRFISSYIAIRTFGKKLPAESLTDTQKDQLFTTLIQ